MFKKWWVRGIAVFLVAVVIAGTLFGFSLRVSVKPQKGMVGIGVHVVYAATESLYPDGQVTWTNLDGNYLDVDDDPDTPDGNWGDAISNNADTLAHVTFPPPTGNLNTGAGLQEFRIWVKKWNGTGTPTVYVNLYENGASLATVIASSSVTSDTGQLFSGTWDASLLTNIDGSGVEAYVYGTKSGGSPTARATVSVGAVEWNADYSTGAPNITVTPISYDFSVVNESSTPSTSTTYFTIDNTSTMQTDQDIRVTTATWSGGVTWVHSDTAMAGVDTAGLLANKGGTWGTGDVIVKYNSPYNYIAENQPVNTDYQFGLKLIAPTSFSDGVEKQITVRITAVAG